MLLGSWLLLGCTFPERAVVELSDAYCHPPLSRSGTGSSPRRTCRALEPQHIINVGAIT